MPHISFMTFSGTIEEIQANLLALLLDEPFQVLQHLPPLFIFAMPPFLYMPPPIIFVMPPFL